MPLDVRIKQILEQNMNTTLGVLQSTKSDKKELEKFSKYWDTTESNIYDVMHGFIIGDIVGSAIMTARTMLNRPLTEEENHEINTMAQSKKYEIKDLITRLKSA